MSLFKDRVRYLVADLKKRWAPKPAAPQGYLPKAKSKPAEGDAPLLAAKAYERK